MGLTHPLGLLLLGGVAALFWFFRKRDRIRDARPVSTRRWFTEVSAQQVPQWTWHLWPLLCALCALMLAFTWLWAQPHKTLLPAATDVWDGRLNMPDQPHRAGTIAGKEGLPEWLKTHAGDLILHTNLQVGAWGDVTTLPDRVRIAPEPLPKSVGIANAGIVDRKIWAQLQNTTGTPWSGTLTLKVDGRAVSATRVEVGTDGAFAMIDCPRDLTAGMLSIDGPDPWKWDDTFFIGRKKEAVRIALETDNPFLRTWGQLYDVTDPARAQTVILTEWQPAQVSELLKRGLLVVVFCDVDNVDGLEPFGIRIASRSAVRERGITIAWPDLDSLRIVAFTTVAETAGWDQVDWAGESGRVFVGEKRIGVGTLRAVMGPLTMPQTELPLLPLFLPWMSRLAGLQRDRGLPALWSTDRSKTPGITDAGIVNYDRALIQPVGGRVKSEPGAAQAPVVVAWNALLWISLGCAGIMSVYLWQKKY